VSGTVPVCRWQSLRTLWPPEYQNLPKSFNCSTSFRVFDTWPKLKSFRLRKENRQRIRDQNLMKTR
jgi:hypothetical protein